MLKYLKRILKYGTKRYYKIKHEWDYLTDESEDGFIKSREFSNGLPVIDKEEVYAINKLRKKGFDWFFNKVADCECEIGEFAYDWILCPFMEEYGKRRR